MDAVRKSVAIIRSVDEIAGGYDVWLCDVWGVIHNGREAFRPAVEACHRFRKNGGTVVLITNAPRPGSAVRQQLTETYGVEPEAYDVIVTSGDVTRSLIARWSGRPVFHLGPQRDLPIFEGLDVDLAGAGAAEVIVNTGLFDDHVEKPDDYRDMLSGFQQRGLTMICANPDLVVERGNDLVYCAGALAEVYRDFGGEVLYAGKPHLPIYDLCLSEAGEVRGREVARARVLAIGDGLKTDIAGAEAAGIDALFIPSGVHVARGRALDGGLLEDLFQAGAKPPVAAIAGLR